MSYTKWETQREKCLSCKHCLVQDDPKQDKPGTIMRCQIIKIRGRGRFEYCIEARDGGKCGPEATLYEAA